MPPHGPHHPPHHGPPHPPEPPRRPGRPPSVGADTPLNVKISQTELSLLDDCAARLSVSRAETVRQGLRLLQAAVGDAGGERVDRLHPVPTPRRAPSGVSLAWPSADQSGVTASADGLYAELNTTPSSITREQLETLLQSVLLATGAPSFCLYLLDCLRLHALATGGILASPEAAARFAGLIQARGGGKGEEQWRPPISAAE